jgi:hypothetical protein
MVWNLWSRKRRPIKFIIATGIRGYFPLNLECAYENSTTGSVACKGHSITKTVIDENTLRCYMQKILN